VLRDPGTPVAAKKLTMRVESGTALVLGLALLAVGCKNSRDDVPGQTTLNQASVSVPIQQPPVQPPAPAPPGRGEQSLDTQPVPTPAPAAPAAPIFETKNRNRPVRTPSDENLPKWVPARGRLSVVESSDLAENLGLVPPGTTKKTDERISVADKLAEERASRAETPSQPVSGSYSAGRFVSHR
jgi:hypothetical protein